jgi:DNA-binding transcriptional regulator LsrR (DeoR family)
MKLDKIAELAASGLRQREIGERLGLSQQIISYRLNLIKKNYPELLQTNSTKIQTEYKNTNATKTENFVEKEEPVEESGVVYTKDFRF